MTGRGAARRVVIAAGAVLTVLMLPISRAVVRYDALSRGRHAAWTRSALPWPGTSWVGPVLPLVVLSASDTSGWPWWAGVAWLVGAAAVAEVYSVCLHREAWIAAFEPWFLAEDLRALGGAPPCPDDRRLHFLVRTQFLYSLAPVCVGLVVEPGIAVVAWLLFMAKFFGHASTDFEVFHHWDLHVGALRVVGKPRLTTIVAGVVEWYLGPLHGYVPKVYRADHLLIHHPENSGPQDIHTPLPYRRTSILEFGVYALRTSGSYLFGARIVNHRRCRPQVRRAVLVGVGLYWACGAALIVFGSALGWWFAGVAVLRAVNGTRSQYVWHAFGDPARPRDPMASTMLWVAGSAEWDRLQRLADGDHATRVAVTPDGETDWAFFDNHHLLHHLHPKAHYLEYPDLLRRRVPDMVDAGALVLDLASLETFAFDCWTGDFERLEKAVIFPRPDDLTTLLRARLAPCPRHRSPYGSLCETPMAARIDRGLTTLIGLLTGRRG